MFNLWETHSDGVLRGVKFVALTMADRYSPNVSESGHRGRFQLYLAFLRREWMGCVIALAFGLVMSGALRLLRDDESFRTYLFSTPLFSASHYSGPKPYIPFVAGAAVAVFFACFLLIARNIARGIRSWWAGIVSGFRVYFLLLPLVLTILRGTQHPLFVWLSLFLLAVFQTLAFWRFCSNCTATSTDAQAVTLRLDEQTRSQIGSRLRTSDDPISDWKDDAFDRRALVEALASSLLESKNPVIGLFGDYGSGKSSTLNLLRQHIECMSIVVTFSVWLPGSSETLLASLLSDIARECRKLYVVPGLTTKTRRFAAAFAKSVPLLSGYADFFHPSTQFEDMNRLQLALARLPKRVVVLLDEVDRMQKDELLSLLKVLRGTPVASNLSFVCAMDRKSVEKTILDEFTSESHAYFEKFFPVSLRLPPPDTDVLKDLGITRFVSSFTKQGWFEFQEDGALYRDFLSEAWEPVFSLYLKTPRSLASLANDLTVAAANLLGEVNPIELTLLELLRRFEPVVYTLIWERRDKLTNTSGWSDLRAGFTTAEEKRATWEKLISEFEVNASERPKEEVVKYVLGFLFPKVADALPMRERLSLSSNRGKVIRDSDLSISNLRLLSAYFRYSLPKDVYSSRRLKELVDRCNLQPNFDAELMHEFLSMSKGTPKRESFLRRLSADLLDRPLATKHLVSYALVGAADELDYDLAFAGSGEAGEVLRTIGKVAESTPSEERMSFLARCITEATDDTMAYRIQTVLTKSQEGLNLEISFEDLYPSFIARMRARYSGAIASSVNLNTSDPRAFELWAGQGLQNDAVSPDPLDRSLQEEFWKAYIGSSERRLLRAFTDFLMPKAIYEANPELFVVTKISMQTLRELSAGTIVEELSEKEQKDRSRLDQFLAGNFVAGISIGNSAAF